MSFSDKTSLVIESKVSRLLSRTMMLITFLMVVSGCTPPAQPDSANCVEVGADAVNGHIYTKLMNTTISLDVVAIKNGVQMTNLSPADGFTATLDFVDGTNSNCATALALDIPSQTTSFTSANQGRKMVSVPLKMSGVSAKAYKDVQCRVKVLNTNVNPNTTTTSCSTDHFAIRPKIIAFATATNAYADPTNGTNTTGTTNLVKAGSATLKIGATAQAGYNGSTYLGAGYNYYGTFKIDQTKLIAHTGAPAVGTIGGSFPAADGGTGGGYAQSLNFSYSEVGYFKFGVNGVYDDDFTAIDIANGDCTNDFSNTAVNGKIGCKFGNDSESFYFGRFIPDHFAVTPVSVTPVCGAFTYYGQDNLRTTFTLTAQNASNATTQNYTGSYAKLGLTNWSSYGFSAATLPSGSAIAAGSTSPSGTWFNGVATGVIAYHRITRATTPSGVNNITVSAKPVDSDGVTMTSPGAVSAATLYRYGGLYVANAYGSELLPLPIEAVAQYWDATSSAYRTNTLDACSAINPNQVIMSNYSDNLSACETKLSGGGTAVAGKMSLKLSAPGNGNGGMVLLTPNLQGVSGSTCVASGSVSTLSADLPQFGTTNTSSNATFGQFKAPYIYQRENF